MSVYGPISLSDLMSGERFKVQTVHPETGKDIELDAPSLNELHAMYDETGMTLVACPYGCEVEMGELARCEHGQPTWYAVYEGRASG